MKQRRNSIVIMIIVWFLMSPHFAGAEARKVVLFDEAHGQKFLVGQNGPLDLSSLVAQFHGEGLTIRVNKTKITTEVLADVDALVISGAFLPIAPSEITAITRFLENGGRLSIMLHIGPPVADLLHRMNVSISNGVIHEQENKLRKDGLDYRITRLKPHDLMNGVNSFSVYGGWALINTSNNAEIIAQTSARAWVDLNNDKKLGKGDAVQSFGLVIAGILNQGRFVVFGDDAIFQNRFLVGGNAVLAKNLANWLCNTSKVKEI
jgi:hypothetical protein